MCEILKTAQMLHCNSVTHLRSDMDIFLNGIDSKFSLKV